MDLCVLSYSAWTRLLSSIYILALDLSLFLPLNVFSFLEDLRWLAAFVMYTPILPSISVDLWMSCSKQVFRSAITSSWASLPRFGIKHSLTAMKILAVLKKDAIGFGKANDNILLIYNSEFAQVYLYIISRCSC